MIELACHFGFLRGTRAKFLMQEMAFPVCNLWNAARIMRAIV
jgi:hypothetical protein